MSFLNGWAIAIGAVALLAPVAIHFLTKPSPVAYPLSTIRLLREVIDQRRARSRIRDLLVLLMRVLAVGLLALALARPLWEVTPVVAVQSSGESARVVLMDVSQSMSAGVAGSTAMHRAQAIALRYWDYAPGLQADLLFVGAEPRSVFDRLSPNLASLRESVRQAAPRPERANAKAALEKAGRLLAASSAAKRELVLISDFQRANWGSLYLDFLPQDTNVQLESVAEPVAANVAITAVRFPSPPIAGQQSPLEIELVNFSDRDADVRCRVDFAAWQQSLEGTIPAEGNRVLTAVAEFPEVGWLSGWARLESNVDALAADDLRPAAVFVGPKPKTLLVSRQPAQQNPSSSYYLERALQILVGPVHDGRSETLSVERVQPQRIDPAGWPKADLFVVDHPGALDDAAVKHIATRVRRGKALLYVTAELADGINLERLVQAVGSGFQPPVELVPPRDGVVRRNLFVNQLRTREMPFHIFGANGATAMRSVRIGGGLATRRTREGLREQVLAELSDGSALLYVTACDAGQISVLNADLNHSNWCVQPSFLPMLAELVHRLLSGRSQPAEAHCGEPLVRLLPAEIPSDAALAAGVADDNTVAAAEYGKWEWSPSQGSLVWSWPQPEGPGIYQLSTNNRVVLMTATAAPAAEADLKTLDRSVRQGRLAGSRNVGYRDTTDDETDDQLWNWLIVGCVLGLAAEIAALRWFQS